MSRFGQGNLSKPGGRQSRQFGAACTALAWLAIQRAATPHQAKEGGRKLHRERSLFTSMHRRCRGQIYAPVQRCFCLPFRYQRTWENESCTVVLSRP